MLGLGHVLILLILVLFRKAILTIDLLLCCFTTIGLVYEACTTAKTRSALVLKIWKSGHVVPVNVRIAWYLLVALFIIETTLRSGIVKILLDHHLLRCLRLDCLILCQNAPNIENGLTAEAYRV